MIQVVGLLDKYLKSSIITILNEAVVNILRNEKRYIISRKIKTQKQVNGHFRTKKYNVWNLREIIIEWVNGRL